MEQSALLDQLSALAHEGRLAAYQSILREGEQGITAGRLAEKLAIASNTLSAQLNILSRARLIVSERQGRHIVYRADLDVMRECLLSLIEDCCNGHPEICAPVLSVLVSQREKQSCREC